MFRSISDPFIAAALWTGLGAFLLAAGLVLLIAALRLRLRRHERRWRGFVDAWRPSLLAVALDPEATAPAPRLQVRDHPHFLRLWAYLHESLRGAAADRLNEFARALGMEASLRRLLARGSRAEKLQAILAAGYLRDAGAWQELARLTDGNDSLLAVNAARALVRIDPMAAAERLVPLVVTRTDWDLGRVAAFLSDARHAFWLVMTRLIPQLQRPQLLRALRLAEALRLQLPPPTLGRLLLPDQPADVVAAALKLCDTPVLLPQVLGCLDRPEPAVRSQAALQMGKLAGRSDVVRLATLLDDADWTVRLHAARALAQLPFLDRTELEALSRPHPAAADLLRQAAAERGLG